MVLASVAAATIWCYGFLGIVSRCEMPDSQPSVNTACPRIQGWSAAEQKQVAAELNKLGRGSASGRAIRGYINLRDQTRACLNRR